MYSYCEHKLGPEKNKKIKYSFSRVAKAHEHEIIQIWVLKCNNIFLSVPVKVHSRLHNVV